MLIVKKLAGSFWMQGLLLLFSMTIFAPGVKSEIVVIDENPALFGNLDQHNTNCPHNGCGPTAAVNSLVFLQNRYPVIYNVDGLVPSADPLHPTQAEQAAIANRLMAEMKTCCNNGTYWGNFITGKQDYLEKVASDTTDSSAQADYTWDTTLAGPKPGPGSGMTVQDNTIPTIGFILNALEHNQDLELLITDSDGNNGHYITVTGISWDTEDETGHISYVDPKDGMDHTSLIVGTPGDPLSIEAGVGTAEIRVAVDESPIPEPGTILLLSTGLLGIAGNIRRKFCGSGCRRLNTRN